MTYQFLTSLWSICVFSAFVLGTTLVGRLIFGVAKRNETVIKSTLKYLVNIIVCFVFSFYAYISFALWVTAPKGTTKQESFIFLKQLTVSSVIQWTLYALICVVALIMFNIFYQMKVEGKKHVQSIVLLAIAGTVVMFAAIAIGSLTAYFGLLAEITSRA